MSGHVTVPAAEHADAVIVTGATTISRGGGEHVRRGPVVLSDVRFWQSTVDQAPGSQVIGTVRDLGGDIAGMGLVPAPALFLIALRTVRRRGGHHVAMA